MSSKRNKLYSDSDSDSDSDCSSDDEDSRDVKKKNTKKKKVLRGRERHPSSSGRDIIHSVKLGLISFVFYILIMSDVFVERVMSKTTFGLVEGRSPTKKGICAQGVLLIIGVIIIDLLIMKEKI
jgi:hypothetical protein